MVVVDGSVVEWADQDAFAQTGGLSDRPGHFGWGSLCPLRRPIAPPPLCALCGGTPSGEGAAAVAVGHGLALGFGEAALLGPMIQGQGRAAEDLGDDAQVAGTYTEDLTGSKLDRHVALGFWQPETTPVGAVTVINHPELGPRPRQAFPLHQALVLDRINLSGGFVLVGDPHRPGPQILQAEPAGIPDQRVLTRLPLLRSGPGRQVGYGGGDDAGLARTDLTTTQSLPGPDRAFKCFAHADQLIPGSAVTTKAPSQHGPGGRGTKILGQP